jgi:GT2 family glycosyltransferase
MPASQQPHVTVIVPNFNGRSYLEECLDSLQGQSYDNYSLILVDNASSDGSAELARSSFPQVELVENTRNIGFAGGCNAGIRRALKGDTKYLVLVNSDTSADRDWLSELVAVAESDERIGICQSMIYMAGRPQVINTAGNESHFLAFGYCGHYLETDSGQFGEVHDIPFASGSSMLARREVFEQIGLMDEDLFLYQEDLDLCWRARLAGWRVVLAPRSKIYHHYSFSRNDEKFYYLERNRLLVSLKNYSTRSLLVLAPAYLGAELAMLGYSLAGGWGGRKLKGYGYLLRHRGEIASKRRRVQRSRKVSDKEAAGFWTDRMEFADFSDSPLTRIATPLSRTYWWLARRLL